MPERPAPLVLVTTPAEGQPAGSHAAVAAEGRRLLAAELSKRLERLGAAVATLPFEVGLTSFHWGRWFASAARARLGETEGPVSAIGYAGGASMALLADDDIGALLSPAGGACVANNRFSTDAFVVAGDLDAALIALGACEVDNGAARHLEEAVFTVRDLGESAWSRFDVDTTLDLALLRVATGLSGPRQPDASVLSFLETARLPGGGALDVPHLDAIGEVMRDRDAELVVAGRVPVGTWRELEADTACRVRCFIEERGMRSARAGGQPPRSILAAFMARTSPAELVTELGRLGDAVILDTRVLMAAVGGSADAASWPPEEERFASDFGDASRVETQWLRELVEAANASSVPFLFGGHALISDGLRLILAAAWQGR